MRALARPETEYTYEPAVEVNRLIQYRDKVHEDARENRHIPPVGQFGQVLIATWNIANLGVHKRRDSDIEVIATMLSWFEIVAIQEVADNLQDFRRVFDKLPEHFDWIFSDRAGNDERAAYIYDTRRVSLGPKVGELAIVESDRRHVRLPGIRRSFHGFNRTPYLVGFVVEEADLLIANCHLLFGPNKTAAQRKESIERRQLEAFAVSRWCELRRRDKHAWTKNVLAVGDFNLPRAERGDLIFDALTSRGLRLPPHGTRIPTNVSNTADYDQIAVAPGLLSRVDGMGVFDFDGVIFEDIYDARASGYWRKCAKYYISDHRPLWMQLSL